MTDALRSFSIRSMVAAKQTEASENLLDAIVVEHKSKFINTQIHILTAAIGTPFGALFESH